MPVWSTATRIGDQRSTAASSAASCWLNGASRSVSSWRVHSTSPTCSTTASTHRSRRRATSTPIHVGPSPARSGEPAAGCSAARISCHDSHAPWPALGTQSSSSAARAPYSARRSASQRASASGDHSAPETSQTRRYRPSASASRSGVRCSEPGTTPSRTSRQREANGLPSPLCLAPDFRRCCNLFRVTFEHIFRASQVCPAQPPSGPGLSPRVRGNRRLWHVRGDWAGSIPACAGEPAASRYGSGAVEVYPRVCGGTAGPGTSPPESKGLSPRVRGNHGARARGPALPGSIPACAGEPARSRSRCWRDRVYPRVCGGTESSPAAISAWWGLSPRVRGNRRQATTTVARFGSIPACAGEPRAGFGAARVVGVYPRVCGGTLLDVGHAQRAEGLSPRVRGNREGSGRLAAGAGSIPACAGEPAFQ